jgi:hypothetical protein
MKHETAATGKQTVATAAERPRVIPSVIATFKAYLLPIANLLPVP